MAVQADVHDTVLDLHVPAQVSLEVELARAVGALEGLAARVQVHVAQQVVHPVEGFPAHLEHTRRHPQPTGSPGLPPPPWLRLTADSTHFVLFYVAPEAREAGNRASWLVTVSVCFTLPELEFSAAQRPDLRPH